MPCVLWVCVQGSDKQLMLALELWLLREKLQQCWLLSLGKDNSTTSISAALRRWLVHVLKRDSSLGHEIRNQKMPFPTPCTNIFPEFHLDVV